MVHYIHLETPKESVSSGMKTLPARRERGRPRTVFLRAARKVNEDREVAGFSTRKRETPTFHGDARWLASIFYCLPLGARIPLLSLSLLLLLLFRHPLGFLVFLAFPRTQSRLLYARADNRRFSISFGA